MTNAERYFENVVNVQHTVLGVKLKPLCILHYLWLQHLHSPLVETSKPAKIEDLELAVLVCSSGSSEEILAKIATPKLLSLAGVRRVLWHRANSNKHLRTELLRFIAYQDDFCSLPELVQREAQHTHEKLPWLLVHVAALVKETGWRESEVMQMPLGKVVWLNTAFSYIATGETSVLSDTEREGMEALRALTQAA